MVQWLILGKNVHSVSVHPDRRPNRGDTGHTDWECNVCLKLKNCILVMFYIAYWFPSNSSSK